MPATGDILRSICFVLCFLAANVSRAELQIYPTDGNLLWGGMFDSQGPLIEDPVFNINAVIDHWVASQYWAITWQNVRLFNETAGPGVFPATRLIVQVVWFEAPTVIKGVQFQADEIVFSYVGHQPGTSDFGDLFATVG